MEQVLRRDRAVVLAALAAVAALAWAYVIRLASGMDMAAPMDGMAGMDMPRMAAPALAPWSRADFLFMFAMWAVMMVGMMLPSVAPMVLLYARVARQAASRGAPFAATGWFVAGYLLAWTGFALAATTAQWGLERAALLSPAMASASAVFGGVLLLAAGVYQWTPLKRTCLAQCQAPFAFIQRHGGLRRDAAGALGLGVRHGLYCIGCCWALMGLLFVGGVMNLLWIAAIAVYVLLEKVLVTGQAVPRLVGTALIAAGIWMLAA
jgi:predicted metal-binding membrane protein